LTPFLSATLRNVGSGVGLGFGVEDGVGSGVGLGSGVEDGVGINVFVGIGVGVFVEVGNSVDFTSHEANAKLAALVTTIFRKSRRDSFCVIFLFTLFCKGRANGTRFSRREASAASEAVGWKRRLGGLILLTSDHPFPY
jgi:hypothetical protein